MVERTKNNCGVVTMTELKMLQNKMNKISKRTDWEVWNTLHNCEKMVQGDGDKKAVVAFLQMAINFYGKERVLAGIENFGFEQLKKYIK